jgi:hypothetical protein
MSKTSINVKTRDLLKERGFTAVHKVESFNSFTKRYSDLFGIWDFLAVGNGETIAVQVTSKSNVSSRIKKIEDSEHIAACREAGWQLEVHGWFKNKSKRWECKVVDIS